MEAIKYYFLVIFLLLHYPVFDFVVAESYDCSAGMRTHGYTFPKGDIVLKVGSPLEILCIIEPHQGGNASSLHFQRESDIVKSGVTIINDTTIRLYIPRAEEFVGYYWCHAKDEVENSTIGICLNHVEIGYEPLKIENFTCYSWNWEYLNCSWVVPKNTVTTSYELSYHQQKKKSVYPCPTNYLKQNYCVWNASSSPIYRIALGTYFFTMMGTNQLGKIKQEFVINHFANVIPNKPQNLSLVEASFNSLVIKWKIPPSLESFPPGLVHKVMYQSRWEPNYWHLVNTSYLDNSSVTLVYNISHLKYAHTLYDIRVMMRSAEAEDNTARWSEPATITLRTKASVPGQPPKTHKGSFESLVINGEFVRNVYIYWQQVPGYLENGDGFEYKIVRVEEEVNGNQWESRNLKPFEVTKSMAKFRNMGNTSYRFFIISSNKEGVSVNTSCITVPGIDQIPPAPISFSKIAFEHGVYELSWRPATNIRNYTIFWCENKLDRPYDCKGFLNWTEVTVDLHTNKCDRVDCSLVQKNITLSEDKFYQFALSADTQNSSSGMVWASCTVLPDKTTGKLKHVWINRIGARFMEVGWKLDCFDISRKIRGFIISYCPIVDPQNSRCKEDSKDSYIEGGADVSRGNITNLSPYTTYRVQVSVKSDDIGSTSDPLLNTTLEAAPENPPMDFKAIEIHNSSVSLAWRPPIPLNGVLRYYIIRWSNLTHSNSSRIEDKSFEVKANLTGLNGFTTYNITVSACTNECSTNTSTVIVKTKIGSPGQVGTPRVSFFNKTEMHINVTWDQPQQKNGIIDHYVLNLQTDGRKEIQENEYVITGLSFQKSIVECESYTVKVRAVTIGEDGSELFGLWSTQDSGFCSSWGSSIELNQVLMSLLILIIITICFALGCFTRWCWAWCKHMQNVEVKLPAHLVELNIIFKEKSSPDPIMNGHVSSTQVKSLDVKHIPPPDQELLLEKKDKDELIESSLDDCEDNNVDRESSGCGSGHDSVSSSITAGTHITDSGTEADERPPSPESPVFPNTPRRTNSDIRPRNSSPNVSSGEGYSRLAPAPSELPSGYIAVQSGLRGYVTHAPFWNAQTVSSKGYISSGPNNALNSHTIYSKVGLKPSSIIPPDDNFSSSNRDHVVTDADSTVGEDNQFSIN